MIKAVLFDIDGTLLDTTELLYQAFEYSIKSQGLVPPSREKMAKVIGVSLEKCYLAFAPAGDNALLCKTHNQFQLENPELAKTFPNTIKILKKLKELGIKTAGITNRWESTAKVSAERTGILKYLEFINYRDGFEKIKPDPEMLLDAIRKLEVKKDEVLMVGDTAIDIEAGKAADVETVGVTFGFLGEEIKELNPDFIIDDLEEILEIISEE